MASETTPDVAHQPSGVAAAPDLAAWLIAKRAVRKNALIVHAYFQITLHGMLAHIAGASCVARDWLFWPRFCLHVALAGETDSEHDEPEATSKKLGPWIAFLLTFRPQIARSG